MMSSFPASERSADSFEGGKMWDVFEPLNRRPDDVPPDAAPSAPIDIEEEVEVEEEEDLTGVITP